MSAPGPRRQVLRLALIALVAAALFAGLQAHLQGLNGPPYWRWTWRSLPVLTVFGGLLLASLPFAAAQWLHSRAGERRRRLCLGLLMLAHLACQLLVGVWGGGEWDPARPAALLRHPHRTSYYADAHDFDGLVAWLSAYPERMAGRHMHARNKPPGALLLCATLRALAGESAGAWWGVGLLAALAACCLPACYGLLRVLRLDHDVAFAATSLFALAPGLVLVFPGFDQLAPLWTCGLWALWTVALREESPSSKRAALGFGLLLAGALFFSYSLLVLGLLFALVAVRSLRALGPRTVSLQVLRALAVCLAFYGVLHLLTGFDPWRTFRTALENQAGLLELIPRPWPQTIGYDLLDFLLGAGWLPGLLAVFCLMDPVSRERRGLALLCVLELLIVAASGLLPGETARVWLFLQPLLLIPAGCELARWPGWARSLVYLCGWLLLAACMQNLSM